METEEDSLDLTYLRSVALGVNVSADNPCLLPS